MHNYLKTKILQYPKLIPFLKKSYIEVDATNMKKINNNSIDIVFSNSFIEHVGSFEQQKLMAEDIKRISKSFYIQTPNKFFPIELHFLFPLFQFSPIYIKAFLIRYIKAFLIRNFNLGWYKKEKDRKKSFAIAKEIRLLSNKELIDLFPGCNIYEERIFGITKSFIICN